MPVFNNILVASQLEESAANVLARWMPTYLREIERQMELPIGEIPHPVHYSNRNSFDVQAGEKYPKIVVISPGLEGTPITDGSGVYRAVWRLGVGAAIASSSETKANLWAKIYGAAIRAVMVKNASLGGIANGVRWFDETYEDLPIINQHQQYRAAAVYFNVECENVLTRWGGPEIPDDEPYGYGQVEDVIIEIIKEPINA